MKKRNIIISASCMLLAYTTYKICKNKKHIKSLENDIDMILHERVGYKEEREKTYEKRK